MLDRIVCITSFVRTVETGSFSAVAREMDTTQPSISKRIAALEEYLDVQLLVRSTRKVRLTEEGERFYEDCQQILEALSEAEAKVGKRQQPSGTLRVNCSIAFGQMQIVPRLKGFLDRYPDIKVDLTLADYYIDLVREGIDLAIRIGNFFDPNLLFQPIGSARLVAVASIQYLKKFGEPKMPSELEMHNCIVYTRQSSMNEWHFRDTKLIVKGNLQVNDSSALREAIIAGIGIGTSPLWAFSEAIKQNLVKVILENYESATLPINVVYRRGRFQSAKAKCFIDFLQSEFEYGLS